jgi:hypothetical protein
MTSGRSLTGDDRDFGVRQWLSINNLNLLKKNAGLRQHHLADGLNRPAVQLAVNCKRRLRIDINLHIVIIILFYYKPK